MTVEQQKKGSFVRHELLSLLKEIDCNIISSEYQVIGGDEYVQVNWLYHGSGMKYHMKINVTADSLKALTIDVLRHI